MPRLSLHPPLLNSATPWATTLDNLIDVLSSPSTGGVTTRTSLINAFDHQHDQHQYLFFNPATTVPNPGSSSTPECPEGHTNNATASLNNLGYSPIPLDGYLDFLSTISQRFPQLKKTVIVSVTGPPEEIKICYQRIEAASRRLPFPVAMEINISCPNIPDAPPPAYDGQALSRYLAVLPTEPTLAIGIKTPPYTHIGQFTAMIDALKGVASSISFITATNTLGSCLILDQDSPQLPGLGIGGMAGPPLHPLALGNVSTIRRHLDEEPTLRHVQIIGVGGVRDGPGYKRMRAAGASFVAVGTGLGDQGVDVFERIERDVGW